MAASPRPVLHTTGLSIMAAASPRSLHVPVPLSPLSGGASPRRVLAAAMALESPSSASSVVDGVGADPTSGEEESDPILALMAHSRNAAAAKSTFLASYGIGQEEYTSRLAALEREHRARGGRTLATEAEEPPPPPPDESPSTKRKTRRELRREQEIVQRRELATTEDVDGASPRARLGVDSTLSSRVPDHLQLFGIAAPNNTATAAAAAGAQPTSRFVPLPSVGRQFIDEYFEDTAASPPASAGADDPDAILARADEGELGTFHERDAGENARRRHAGFYARAGVVAGDERLRTRMSDWSPAPNADDPNAAVAASASPPPARALGSLAVDAQPRNLRSVSHAMEFLRSSSHLGASEVFHSEMARPHATRARELQQAAAQWSVEEGARAAEEAQEDEAQAARQARLERQWNKERRQLEAQKEADAAARLERTQKPGAGKKGATSQASKKAKSSLGGGSGSNSKKALRSKKKSSPRAAGGDANASSFSSPASPMAMSPSSKTADDANSAFFTNSDQSAVLASIEARRVDLERALREGVDEEDDDDEGDDVDDDEPRDEDELAEDDTVLASPRSTVLSSPRKGVGLLTSEEEEEEDEGVTFTRRTSHFDSDASEISESPSIAALLSVDADDIEDDEESVELGHKVFVLATGAAALASVSSDADLGTSPSPPPAPTDATTINDESEEALPSGAMSAPARKSGATPSTLASPLAQSSKLTPSSLRARAEAAAARRAEVERVRAAATEKRLLELDAEAAAAAAAEDTSKRLPAPPVRPRAPSLLMTALQAPQGDHDLMVRRLRMLSSGATSLAQHVAVGGAPPPPPPRADAREAEMRRRAVARATEQGRIDAAAGATPLSPASPASVAPSRIGTAPLSVSVGSSPSSPTGVVDLSRAWRARSPASAGFDPFANLKDLMARNQALGAELRLQVMAEHPPLPPTGSNTHTAAATTTTASGTASPAQRPDTSPTLTYSPAISATHSGTNSPRRSPPPQVMLQSPLRKPLTIPVASSIEDASVADRAAQTRTAPPQPLSPATPKPAGLSSPMHRPATRPAPKTRTTASGKPLPRAISITVSASDTPVTGPSSPNNASMTPITTHAVASSPSSRALHGGTNRSTSIPTPIPGGASNVGTPASAPVASVSVTSSAVGSTSTSQRASPAGTPRLGATAPRTSVRSSHAISRTTSLTNSPASTRRGSAVPSSNKSGGGGGGGGKFRGGVTDGSSVGSSPKLQRSSAGGAPSPLALTPADASLGAALLLASAPEPSRRHSSSLRRASRTADRYGSGVSDGSPVLGPRGLLTGASGGHTTASGSSSSAVPALSARDSSLVDRLTQPIHRRPSKAPKTSVYIPVKTETMPDWGMTDPEQALAPHTIQSLATFAFAATPSSGASTSVGIGVTSSSEETEDPSFHDGGIWSTLSARASGTALGVTVRIPHARPGVHAVPAPELSPKGPEPLSVQASLPTPPEPELLQQWHEAEPDPEEDEPDEDEEEEEEEDDDAEYDEDENDEERSDEEEQQAEAEEAFEDLIESDPQAVESQPIDASIESVTEDVAPFHSADPDMPVEDASTAEADHSAGATSSNAVVSTNATADTHSSSPLLTPLNLALTGDGDEPLIEVDDDVPHDEEEEVGEAPEVHDASPHVNEPPAADEATEELSSRMDPPTESPTFVPLEQLLADDSAFDEVDTDAEDVAAVALSTPAEAVVGDVDPVTLEIIRDLAAVSAAAGAETDINAAAADSLETSARSLSPVPLINVMRRPAALATISFPTPPRTPQPESEDARYVAELERELLRPATTPSGEALHGAVDHFAPAAAASRVLHSRPPRIRMGDLSPASPDAELVATEAALAVEVARAAAMAIAPSDLLRVTQLRATAAASRKARDAVPRVRQALAAAVDRERLARLTEEWLRAHPQEGEHVVVADATFEEKDPSSGPSRCPPRATITAALMSASPSAPKIAGEGARGSSRVREVPTYRLAQLEREAAFRARAAARAIPLVLDPLLTAPTSPPRTASRLHGGLPRATMPLPVASSSFAFYARPHAPPIEVVFDEPPPTSFASLTSPQRQRPPPPSHEPTHHGSMSARVPGEWSATTHATYEYAQTASSLPSSPRGLLSPRTRRRVSPLSHTGPVPASHVAPPMQVASSAGVLPSPSNLSAALLRRSDYGGAANLQAVAPPLFPSYHAYRATILARRTTVTRDVAAHAAEHAARFAASATAKGAGAMQGQHDELPRRAPTHAPQVLRIEHAGPRRRTASDGITS